MKVVVAHLLNLSDVPSLLQGQHTSCELLPTLRTGHRKREAPRAAAQVTRRQWRPGVWPQPPGRGHVCTVCPRHSTALCPSLARPLRGEFPEKECFSDSKTLSFLKRASGVAIPSALCFSAQQSSASLSSPPQTSESTQQLPAEMSPARQSGPRTEFAWPDGVRSPLQVSGSAPSTKHMARPPPAA